MVVGHQRWTNDRSPLRRRCVGLLNIFIYYFYLIVAVHPCSFWPIITELYLWQRGSAVASCRARIKSRIRFRGEGESDVESLGSGIYDRLLLASLLRRGARHNLRYKKIDVVDSPIIHEAFVTALVAAFHSGNMKILFSFLRNSRTKSFRETRLNHVSGKL